MTKIKCQGCGHHYTGDTECGYCGAYFNFDSETTHRITTFNSQDRHELQGAGLKLLRLTGQTIAELKQKGVSINDFSEAMRHMKARTSEVAILPTLFLEGGENKTLGQQILLVQQWEKNLKQGFSLTNCHAIIPEVQDLVATLATLGDSIPYVEFIAKDNHNHFARTFSKSSPQDPTLPMVSIDVLNQRTNSPHVIFIDAYHTAKDVSKRLGVIPLVFPDTNTR